jgi:hypothetical protein
VLRHDTWCEDDKEHVKPKKSPSHVQAMKEGIEPVTPGRVERLEPHPSHIAIQQACLKDLPDPTPQGLLKEMNRLAASHCALYPPNISAAPHPGGPFHIQNMYHGPYGDARSYNGRTNPDPAARFQHAFKQHGRYAQAARRAVRWDKHVGVLNEFSYPDSRVGGNADYDVGGGFGGDPDLGFGGDPDYGYRGETEYQFGGNPDYGCGGDPGYGFGGGLDVGED